jgi:hypothetical protein
VDTLSRDDQEVKRRVAETTRRFVAVEINQEVLQRKYRGVEDDNKLIRRRYEKLEREALTMETAIIERISSLHRQKVRHVVDPVTASFLLSPSLHCPFCCSSSADQALFSCVAGNRQLSHSGYATKTC